MVDNLGDVGVCWRLVKRLSQTHFISKDHFTTDSHDHFRLFCDQVDLIKKIAGEKELTEAFSRGVEILPMESANEAMNEDNFPNVVLETFSCNLPPAYTNQLKKYPSTLIINIEYLSAEDWISSSHGLASPPSQAEGLLRFFYYPGFTINSGGLLQGNLSFSDDLIPSNLKQVWRQLSPKIEAKRISLFNYGGEKTKRLLQEIFERNEVVDLLVCGDYSKAITEEWLGENFSKPLFRNSLQCIPIPFVPQDDYDWLLHQCDFNIVRGEDSFVRAQWAGKPFIWDIYPQEDDAHLLKLNAFLDLYLNNANLPTQIAVRNAMNWRPLNLWWESLADMTNQAKAWQHQMLTQQKNGDLAHRLREFILTKRKTS